MKGSIAVMFWRFWFEEKAPAEMKSNPTVNLPEEFLN